MVPEAVPRLARADAAVPDYVSFYAQTEGRGNTNVGPGFLGSRYAPIYLHEEPTPPNIRRQEKITDVDHADREALFKRAGVLAVELFLTTDGLVVNELAARPHNAGHVTIEGCPTSQFENHVRAVLDLPLGPTWANAPAAVTINVIGGFEYVDPANNLPEALAVEGAQVHLYGKIPRPGRKLGHVTALGDDVDQARELARRAEAFLLGRRP